MDSPLGSSGFDRSEMIPPVPAPRYKRKLITTEDSKHSPNKQNTGMSEQTTEVVPPPRRKRKPQKNYKIYLNNVESKNLQVNSENSTSTFKELQITSSEEQSPTSSEKVFIEVKHSDKNSELNYSNVDDRNRSETTDAFREIVDSSILKNFIKNRVLDIPLEKEENSSFNYDKEISTQSFEVDHYKENRVNSLTENSATIVGVFYKPEYSLINQFGNKPTNSNLNAELDSSVWSCSYFEDGINKNDVPPTDPLGKNFLMNKKDSEEDDSGVYFSDSKSPPHKTNIVGNANRNVNEEIDTSNLQVSEPSTSNDRDTVDNNSSDLGPNMYDQVLDSFEAHTVSAFREEVTELLSLCSELSKSEAVESWLDKGEYPKRKVINSNLSEYLRNMLEVEESERSLSPYPLSTVDESSNVSENGADKIEMVGQDACTVPIISETQENRNVDFSDKYLSFVDINDVHIVNTKCTEVTPCIVLGSVECSKADENNDSIGNLKISNLNDSNQYYHYFKTASHPESVSPSIEHGAVNKLINFFETIHTEEDLDQENISLCEDKIVEVTETVDKLEESLGESYHNNETSSCDHNVYSMIHEQYKDESNSSDLNQENITLPEDKIVEATKTVDTLLETSNESYHSNEINSFGHTVDSMIHERYKDESNSSDLNQENITLPEDKIVEATKTVDTLLETSKESYQSNEINSFGHTVDSMIHEQYKDKSNSSNLDQENISLFENKIVEVTETVGELVETLIESHHNNEINSFGHNIDSMIHEQYKDESNSRLREVHDGEEKDFLHLLTKEESINDDNSFNIFFTNESTSKNSDFEHRVDSNNEINAKSLVLQPTETDEIGLEIDQEKNITFQKKFYNNYYEDNHAFIKNTSYVSLVNRDREGISPPMEFSDKEMPVISVKNETTLVNSKVPNFNISTKDQPESDDVCTLKPTRIPIVVLTEADIVSPVGSIELHSENFPIEDNDSKGITEMCEEVPLKKVIDCAPDKIQDIGEDSVTLLNTITVELEKNWGSIGLKIKGDMDGVFISDILAGGAADQCGLIFKGFIFAEKPQEWISS